MNFNPLAAANTKFREGKYLEAIHFYDQAISEYPALKGSIEFTKNLCKTKLESGKIINTNIAATVTVTSLREILFRQPKVDLAVPYESYLILVDDILTENILDRTALEILRCVACSPFQRELLFTAAWVLNETGNGLLLQEASSQTNINIGKLIRLASEPEYWIANKYKIAEQFEVDWNFSSRAQALIKKPPRNVRKPQDGSLTIFDHGFKSTETPDRKTKRITFATILLNEQKFIGRNLCQHYEMCDEWILVEGACQGYPPRKVSEKGLSLDKTEVLINIFPDPLGKIVYVQHGWTKATGEDAKSELRNSYMKYVNSDFLVVVDADEFYLKEHFSAALDKLSNPLVMAVTLPQVHFWKDTSQFITGEYYDISHTRFFRHLKGMRYVKNHNFPEINGKYVHELGQTKFTRTIKETVSGKKKYHYMEPSCFHLGFAKDFDDMRDKTEYYLNRGESITRVSTTKSRAAWFNDDLPEKCKIRKWDGIIPKYINPVIKL